MILDLEVELDDHVFIHFVFALCFVRVNDLCFYDVEVAKWKCYPAAAVSTALSNSARILSPV